MKKQTYRVVTRNNSGGFTIQDFDSPEEIRQHHLQIGTDDCSTDLTIRGLPVFQGLIGPMPEEEQHLGSVVRYETPDAFEALTKKWSETPIKKRRARLEPTNPQE